MAYTQALVIAGGIAHIPILITIGKFIDAKSATRYHSRKSVQSSTKKQLEEVPKTVIESKPKPKPARRTESVPPNTSSNQPQSKQAANKISKAEEISKDNKGSDV